MRTKAVPIMLVFSACIASCSESPSTFNSQSHQADSINAVWWLMFILGTAIYVVVMIMLLIAVFRRRGTLSENSEVPTHTPRRSHTFILLSGVALPLVVLGILFGFTLQAMAALAPDDDADPLVVEVIGHQFWWEVIYPDEGVVTANEIHIPAGQPVEIRLFSDDVIHSFWVPELNGKVDMIPGRTNTLYIDDAAPGRYRGQCAEFCGLQHARMAFYVFADPPDEFALWLENQRQPAPEPISEILYEGREVFLSSSCVYCHAIQGTNASSRLGPDLTHLASRTTIGAGIRPNTRGHLAGWIVDSQSIKPGNQMPPMYLEAEDLQLLLTYLESLE